MKRFLVISFVLFCSFDLTYATQPVVSGLGVIGQGGSNTNALSPSQAQQLAQSASTNQVNAVQAAASNVQTYATGVSNNVVTLGSYVTGMSNSIIGLITNTIIPQGTNDISTLFNQFAAVSNSIIRFLGPYDYYATNLYITADNVFVEGEYSTIHKLFSSSQYFWRTNAFANGMTNFDFLLEAGGNQLYRNITIKNLTFDGGQPADYRLRELQLVNSNTIHLNADGQSVYPLGSYPYNGTCAYTNSFGVVWNNNCGGIIENCRFQNFGGVGLYLTGLGQSVPYTWGPGNALIGCSAVSNCISVFVHGWEPVMLNYQPNFGDAEYMLLNGIAVGNSSFGVCANASNDEINNCSITGCYIGLSVDDSQDNAGPHTLFTGIKLNHDDVGLYTTIGLDFLELDGIYEAATVTNYIRSSWVKFVGGSINNVGIYNDHYAGRYTSPTNNIVQFVGVNVSGIYGYTNCNVKMQDCLILGKCVFDGGYLSDLNNTAFSDNAALFVWTNWNNDVISTNNMFGYYASGMNPGPNGLPIYQGSFAGDGSGLTNLAYLKTMTVSGGSVAFTQNADGSSNASLTISGGSSPSTYWTPPVTNSFVMYLNAESGFTITNTAAGVQTVQTWFDSTGNGNNATVLTGNAPRWLGPGQSGGVFFDINSAVGTAMSLSTTNQLILNQTNCCIIVVCDSAVQPNSSQ